MSEEFDNLYNPDTDDFQNETRTLDWVINQAIQTAMADIHTWLPAQITLVRDSGYVDVQPLLKRKYTNGDLIKLPIIPNIPVQQPRGANWFVKVPYAVGDLGMALFCERSLDAWKSGDGGIVDPNDPRRFDLSDAVFVPGLYPAINPITGAAADEMVLSNGSASITLQTPGTFLIENPQNELFDTLVDLLNTLLSATVNTAIGPQQFTLTTLANLNSIKARLETLTGG